MRLEIKYSSTHRYDIIFLSRNLLQSENISEGDAAHITSHQAIQNPLPSVLPPNLPAQLPSSEKPFTLHICSTFTHLKMSDFPMFDLSLSNYLLPSPMGTLMELPGF